MERKLENGVAAMADFSVLGEEEEEERLEKKIK